MKRNDNRGIFYTFPLAVWMTLFFLIPTCIILVFSFLKPTVNGKIVWEFSMESYKIISNPTFLKVVKFTVIIAIAVTIISVFIAVPTAYFIARSKHKNIFLVLIIIPFWTNFLIRIYSWIAILGSNGLLNNFLLKYNFIDSSIRFLYNPYAITIVTVYTYLPYAILPLYSTIEKFDFSILEASRDLGANSFQTVRKVFLPNINSGVVTAVIFTFIPTLGSYAVPKLIGDKSTMMLGEVIARELTVTGNWPLASSISVLLTAISTFGIIIFLIANKKSKKQEIK